MKEIKELLAKAVEEKIGPEYKVELGKTKKNNGVVYNSLTIRTKEEEMIAPVIHIDEIVMQIRCGLPMKKAVEMIYEAYEKSKAQRFDVDVLDMMDREFILKHVEYQVVNAEKNAEMISKVPSKRLMDLAAIYRVAIRNEEDTASFVLTNQLLKEAKISQKVLDIAATRNTEMVGFSVKTMGQVMAEELCMPEEMCNEMSGEPKMYVLTNDKKCFGASILLYEKYLMELSEKVADDLFILPSSIHEVLALPVSGCELDDLKKMVKDVNDTEVSEQEVLSYKVYRYNRETGEIEVAA